MSNEKREPSPQDRFTREEVLITVRLLARDGAVPPEAAKVICESFAVLTPFPENRAEALAVDARTGQEFHGMGEVIQEAHRRNAQQADTLSEDRPTSPGEPQELA